MACLHFELVAILLLSHAFWFLKDDTQDLKQIVPVHGSHVVALSQAIPKNANGSILT